MLLSVCMITYNHEKYIKESIEGVFQQKTDFKIELIIGEDFSTDNTKMICKKYSASQRITTKLLTSEKNLGVIPNFVRTLKACTGKYIALCEGDDYWTDPFKLQKQVDFLELNHSFSASAHQSIVKYESGKKEFHNFKNLNSDVLYTNDLLFGRLFHTASFVFRSFCIKNINIPTKIAAGDRALFLLCSLFGPIKFFPEALCVYRKSNTGLSQTITYSQIKGDVQIAKWLKGIRSDFPVHKFQMHIHQSIINYSKVIPFYAIFLHYIGFLYHASFDISQNTNEIRKFSIKHIIKKKIYGIYRRIFHSR